MRTIISGPVKPEHLEIADLMAGIRPTSLVTNGRPAPDAKLGIPVTCFPVCERLGMLGETARDYTLCQNADALIVVGENPHLVGIARQYGLPVWEV